MYNATPNQFSHATLRRDPVYEGDPGSGTTMDQGLGMAGGGGNEGNQTNSPWLDENGKTMYQRYKMMKETKRQQALKNTAGNDFGKGQDMPEQGGGGAGDMMGGIMSMFGGGGSGGSGGGFGGMMG